MNGADLGSTCDIGEMIYRGAPTMAPPLFRGHRDLDLMMFSGIFNYALTGLIIHTAFTTVYTYNKTAWLGSQDMYEQ